MQTTQELKSHDRIYKYENLSHLDLAMLPRDKTVVFIPCSPLEEHGPHLPFGVDAFVAEHFSLEMAAKLADQRQDWHFVMMPTIFAGCDTLHFMGSIEVSQRVIRDLVYATASQLAKDGFQRIVTVGAHGGPRHIVALEEVAAKVSWRYRHTKMISATGKLLMDVLHGKFTPKLQELLREKGCPFSEEDLAALKTDYHAGLVETSLMMVIKPDLVKPGYKELKPAVIDKVWKIRRSSGKKCGDGQGHLGWPALARKEIGEAAIALILDDMLPKVTRFLDGDVKVAREFRSIFYYIPIFRSHFLYMSFVGLSFVVFFGLMAYFMRFMSQMMGGV